MKTASNIIRSIIILITFIKSTFGKITGFVKAFPYNDICVCLHKSIFIYIYTHT